MTKNCVICNTSFEAKRADAEVCSSGCRVKNWRKKSDAQKDAGKGIAEMSNYDGKRLLNNIEDEFNYGQPKNIAVFDQISTLLKKHSPSKEDEIFWLKQRLKELGVPYPKEDKSAKVSSLDKEKEQNVKGFAIQPSNFYLENRKKKIGF